MVAVPFTIHPPTSFVSPFKITLKFDDVPENYLITLYVTFLDMLCKKMIEKYFRLNLCLKFYLIH